MAHRLGALALLLIAAAASAQDPTCGPDARALDATLRTDYAGRDLLAGSGGESRSGALARLVRQAEAAPSPVACDSLLHLATALFPDGHLSVGTPRNAPLPPERVRQFGPFPGDFGLRFVGDSAAVLRLPTFDLDAKPAIDSLITAHRERLLRTPYLIVDVRQNGGGGDGSFAGVIPLLYTGPIRASGIEMAATPANRAELAGFAADPRLDEGSRAEVLALLARLDQGEPGAFVALADPGAFDTVLDTVAAMPRAVALLVNGGTASAAEELVVAARQSAKVLVVGAPTYGALDYSNVREQVLPSGERTAYVPTTRRQWLPAFSVDAAGLAPDVRVPEGVEDWPAFALGALLARQALAASGGSGGVR